MDEQTDSSSHLFALIDFAEQPKLMERCSISIDLIESIIKQEQLSGALQIAWIVFLRELKDDLTEAEEKMKNMAEIIKLKTNLAEENGFGLKDLQIQLNEEQHKLLEKERERSTKIINSLNSELKDKEAQLQEIMELKNELVEKISVLFRKRKNAKTKKANLLRENEDLIHELEVQKDVIAHLKQALDDCKNELESKCQISYKEGIKIGRQFAAIEETRVLEELDILKEIQTVLEEDMKKNLVDNI